MFRFSRSLIALTLLASPILCIAKLQEGDRMPDLASYKLEGKLPDELKGKVILLDFWASWCPPCKKSFPVMEDLKKKFADSGLMIIAVSVDEKREDMEQFLKSESFTFCVMRDAKQELVAAADVPTMPTSFLIDRTGKVRFMHVGFQADQTQRQYAEEIQKLLNENKP